MMRDDAVALVKQYLGFRQNLDTTILANMQYQQQQLELSSLRPWFLLSELAQTTTVAEEPRVPLPIDFNYEFEEGTLYYLDDEDKKMEIQKEEYDVLETQYAPLDDADQTGAPEYYALVGNYFHLFPTPDAEYTLKMRYYYKDAALTSNIENQWLKEVPLLLVGKTGSQIAASLRDWKAKQVFDAMTMESMATITVKTVAREVENRTLQIGGPT